MAEIINIKDILGFGERKIIPIRKEPADVIPFTGKRVLEKEEGKWARWGIGFLNEEDSRFLEGKIKDFSDNKHWLNYHGLSYADADQPKVRDRVRELVYLIHFEGRPLYN